MTHERHPTASEPRDGEELSPLVEDCLGAVIDGEAVDWSTVRSESAGTGEAALIDALEGLDQLARHADRQADADLPPVQPVQQDANANSDGPEALPFARWGPLSLRCRLGTGAFGEVFLARDEALGRDVALKLFPPCAARSAGGAEALVHEARRLARVRQENVVAVYGADLHEGRAGFWMEYVRGENLDQRMAVGGRLHGLEATWVGMQLCRALSVIHAAGLLHLDVKASNVLREEGGRIVLTDFGAVVEAESAGAAAAVTCMGTPLAAAPELLRGELPTVAADIYGLGALLYRLVTGAHPVAGASIDEIRRFHEAGARPRLRQVRPELNSTFEGVVERALDPNPRARFASASDMESALLAAAAAQLALPLSALPASAGPNGNGASTAPPHTRARWLRGRWALGALLVLAAAGLAAVALVRGGAGLRRPAWLARSDYFREDFSAPDKNELLRTGWQLLYPDPEHWQLPDAQGRLTLYTLRGDLWTKPQERPSVPNLVAHPFGGDNFRVTALLTDFNPQHNWQQAGVVLMDDPDQYVRLTVGFDGGVHDRPDRLTVGAVFEEAGTVVAQPIATLRPSTGEPLARVWLQIVKEGDNFVLRYREGRDYTPFVELARRDFRLRQKYICLAAFQGITQELPSGTLLPLAWEPVPAHFDQIVVEPLR